MGQSRRIPGSFFLVLAILAVPSMLYGLVNAAEKADECAVIAKSASAQDKAYKTLKCEK
ncbi:MAG: hypothetical protein K8H75_11625 [Sulfuricella sp.]|jgi:hypothetical protein|nr:hypothetical protein [Sulfuricella sp.]